MTEGPLGRDLIFVDDNRNILVLVGIDGQMPPNEMQIGLRELINTEINKALIEAGADIKRTRETVNLTTQEPPSKTQKDELGPKTIHVQQYDVETELEEVSQDLVNLIHNEIVDRVQELGFNITGTKTTVK